MFIFPRLGFMSSSHLVASVTYFILIVRYIHKATTVNGMLVNPPPAPKHPYRTIGCVFNHKSFYANIQVLVDYKFCSYKLWFACWMSNTPTIVPKEEHLDKQSFISRTQTLYWKKWAQYCEECISLSPLLSCRILLGYTLHCDGHAKIIFYPIGLPLELLPLCW